MDLSQSVSPPSSKIDLSRISSNFHEDLLDIGMRLVPSNSKITDINILEELRSGSLSGELLQKIQSFEKGYEVDITQMKETLIKLFKSLNEESKTKSTKQRRLKKLNTLCKENKKNILKLRENIRHQSEKIKLLQRQLSQSPEALKLSQTIQQKTLKPAIKDFRLSPDINLLKSANFDAEQDSPRFKLELSRFPRSKK